jgi:Disulphide bond corrector protein DsbC
VEAAGPLSGPPPEKKQDKSFGLQTHFYTHSFVLSLPVRLKSQLIQGHRWVPVSVRFQSCSDRECLPPATVHLSAALYVPPPAP